jgi:hypothetical protein
MNIRGLIKEELNRQNYLYGLTNIYGDEEVAAYYLDNFCDTINRINQFGGDVYRLVYEDNKQLITPDSKGTGWTPFKETLETKFDHPSVFILRGFAQAGSINMNSTMECYVDNPEDQQVVLIKYPNVSQIHKIK